MVKHIHEGWSKSFDEIPQPVGIVLGGNLRQNSEPKIKQGSSSGVEVLAPGEAAAHGIPTDPVLVIEPVPRTPLTTSLTPRPKPPKRR
jgi:hypothetical protein